MLLTEKIFEYIERHIDPEPEELHRLMRESNLRMVHGRMCSGHLQGRLLVMLTRLAGARNVLELGTFTGYATLCLAEGVGEGGRVDTIEVFDENEDFLREVFGRSPIGERVNLIIGDAKEVMDAIADEWEAERVAMHESKAYPEPAEGLYDLIFIDADKRAYPDYYTRAKRLLKRGGLIVADNTLWDGHVADEERHDRQTMGVKQFNDLVATDPEVEKVIIPLRDGLTLIRKR
ncbi:MAG: O-methyltransferase [Muribaculaceae bacterium]|nr:O-methyltransferase [Muribaculaceae bacterium]